MSPSEAIDQSWDLSGFPLRVRGLPEGCARFFRESWSEFASRPDESAQPDTPPLVDARVAVGGEPVPDGTVTAKTLRAVFETGRAVFEMREGAASIDGDGRAEVRLAPSGAATQFHALLNLLLPCLAWRLPAHGAAVLHAAGVVIDGAAFVLVGPEGSGKSTWVGLAKQAGAVPLSDDVILVDTTGERVHAVGSPFRTKDFGASGPGRWPLAAILLADHGPGAELSPVSRALSRARLLANLPYVAETVGSDASVGGVLERLVTAVPLRVLRFERKPSFVPLLRELAHEG